MWAARTTGADASSRQTADGFGLLWCWVLTRSSPAVGPVARSDICDIRQIRVFLVLRYISPLATSRPAVRPWMVRSSSARRKNLVLMGDKRTELRPCLFSIVLRTSIHTAIEVALGSDIDLRIARGAGGERASCFVCFSVHPPNIGISQRAGGASKRASRGRAIRWQRNLWLADRS